MGKAAALEIAEKAVRAAGSWPAAADGRGTAVRGSGNPAESGGVCVRVVRRLACWTTHRRTGLRWCWVESRAGSRVRDWAKELCRGPACGLLGARAAGHEQPRTRSLAWSGKRVFLLFELKIESDFEFKRDLKRGFETDKEWKYFGKVWDVTVIEKAKVEESIS